MFRPRVIPCLLLKNKGLVKTIRFRDPVYIGDPINAVRIYNQKEADELIFLDIQATEENRSLDIGLLKRIANEAYMPFAVGGGITQVSQARKILTLGAEKVVINSASVTNPSVITKIVNIYGTQSVIVSIDVKKNLFRKEEVYIFSGKKGTGLDPIDHAKHVESLGAGEIMITDIDRDGMMQGYNVSLIQKIADAVSIPVIASGGAGKLEDFRAAISKGHASAVAAGSLFVYHGSRKGVLINYPEKKELEEVFKNM